MNISETKHENINRLDGRGILVTGSHRSGSTWAGQMIAHAPGTGYLHEPFTVGGRLGGFANPFTNWFQYVTDENSDAYESYLNSLINFKYPFIKNVSHSRSAREAADALRNFAKSAMHRLRKDRVVVKDPIAIFSAPWLASHFDLSVLVMIRHPAAFCSSLKVKDWQFDFNHFLRQPRLMHETPLGTFESEIRDYAGNGPAIVDQSILLWNCIHIVIDEYRARHPDWLFIRHEDLSLEPMAEFGAIYKKLNLDFTPEAQAAIKASSSEQNPAEQTKGYDLVRNSRLNVTNWKNRLTEVEIKTIRERTLDVASRFYSDEDW